MLAVPPPPPPPPPPPGAEPVSRCRGGAAAGSAEVNWGDLLSRLRPCPEGTRDPGQRREGDAAAAAPGGLRTWGAGSKAREPRLSGRGRGGCGDAPRLGGALPPGPALGPPHGPRDSPVHLPGLPCAPPGVSFREDSAVARFPASPPSFRRAGGERPGRAYAPRVYLQGRYLGTCLWRALANFKEKRLYRHFCFWSLSSAGV